MRQLVHKYKCSGKTAHPETQNKQQVHKHSKIYIIHADIGEETANGFKRQLQQPTGVYVHNYACSTTRIQHKVEMYQ